MSTACLWCVALPMMRLQPRAACSDIRHAADNFADRCTAGIAAITAWQKAVRSTSINAPLLAAAHHIAEYGFLIEWAAAEAKSLHRVINVAEQGCKLRLAAGRDEVLRWSLLIQLVTMCLGACSMISGWFGELAR